MEDSSILSTVSIIDDIKGDIIDNISGINSFWHCILKCTNSGGYSSLTTKEKNVAVKKLRRKCASMLSEDNTIFETDEIAFEYIKAVNGHPSYAKMMGYSHEEAISKFIKMCRETGKFGVSTPSGIFPPNKEILSLYEDFILRDDDKAREKLSDILSSGEKPLNPLENFDPFVDFSPEFLEKYYEIKSDDDFFYDVSGSEIDLFHSFKKWYFTLLGGTTSFIIYGQGNGRDTLEWEIAEMDAPQHYLNRESISQLLGLGMIIIETDSEGQNSASVYLPQNKECKYLILKMESEENFYPIRIGEKMVYDSGSILIRKIFEGISFDLDIFPDISEVLKKIHLPPKESEIQKSSQMRFLSLAPSGEEERKSTAFSGNTSLRATTISSKKSITKKIVTRAETYDFDFCDTIKSILKEK